MALSNWDTLAFGEDGQPTPGAFPLRGDAVLDIYKNWVYIRHPSAWFDDNGFTGGTVMQIDEGELKYAGCDIIVARNPLQVSCFVFVADRNYLNGTNRFFAGIGCSAYLGLLEYIKRHDPEKLASLPEWTNGLEPAFAGWHSDIGHCFTFERGEEYVDVPVYGLGEDPDTYVGVLPELHAEFLGWLGNTVGRGHGDEAREWLDKVNAAGPLRYNQGDAYFAQHMEHGIPATAIGEQSTTIMEHIIENMDIEKPEAEGDAG